MATPPESPQAALLRDASLQYDDSIIPELDIYAIPSSESTYTCQPLNHHIMQSSNKVEAIARPAQLVAPTHCPSRIQSGSHENEKKNNI